MIGIFLFCVYSFPRSHNIIVFDHWKTEIGNIITSLLYATISVSAISCLLLSSLLVNSMYELQLEMKVLINGFLGINRYLAKKKKVAIGMVFNHEWIIEHLNVKYMDGCQLNCCQSLVHKQISRVIIYDGV